MMKPLIYLFILLWRKEDYKIIHYRMVNVNGKKGCVQANVTRDIGRRFEANIGKCSDVSCKHYQGKTMIPFCCYATGFSC